MDGGSDIWDLLRERNHEHLLRARYQDTGSVAGSQGPRVLILPEEVGRMIGKARKHQAVVIDLRGNPGGSVDTLKYLVAAFLTRSENRRSRRAQGDQARSSQALHNPFV